MGTFFPEKTVNLGEERELKHNKIIAGILWCQIENRKWHTVYGKVCHLTGNFRLISGRTRGRTRLKKVKGNLRKILLLLLGLTSDTLLMRNSIQIFLLEITLW